MIGAATFVVTLPQPTTASSADDMSASCSSFVDTGDISAPACCQFDEIGLTLKQETQPLASYSLSAGASNANICHRFAYVTAIFQL
jgi:hypothetical protein